MTRSGLEKGDLDQADSMADLENLAVEVEKLKAELEKLKADWENLENLEADLVEDSDDEEQSSQEELISKIGAKLEKLSGPEFMCFRCGEELYEHEVQWKERGQDLQTCAELFEELYAAKASMIKTKRGRNKKNPKTYISSCRSCLKDKKHIFQDIGAIPLEIQNLQNYYEKKTLSLGSLFCGSFRPTGYSYEHFIGNASIGPRTDDFSGMIGVLFNGIDLLRSDERDNINLDRVRAALRWLRKNNRIYSEFLPYIETLYYYFKPQGLGAPLPSVNA